MSTLATTNLKNPSSGSDNIVLGTDGSSTLGTAKITTLADSAGANTSTPAEIASGRAKAWVNFDGTGTVAIRASYNVSSITDNGAGDYTVNFATAMPDANYCATACSAIRSGTASTGSIGYHTTSSYSDPPTTYTTTQARFYNGTSNGTAVDSVVVSIAIFR